MPEALKCPTCSAPLDYPAGGGPTAHCPYCNSTVLLPGNLSPSTGSSASGIEDVTAGLGPFVNEALKLAQASDLLRSGRKIEAIKVYRQTFNVDLASAKKAVEDMGSGRPLALNPQPGTNIRSQVTKEVSSGLRYAFGLAIFIIAITGFIIAMAFRGVHHSTISSVPKFAPTIVITPPAIPFALVAPAASTFAHVALEFGSEGIGAGQFKDSRSIAMDGAGHIYVGEYSDGRVQVFDSQGKFLTAWSIGPQKSLLNLAASRNGTVYAVIPGHIDCYEGTSGRMFGEAQIYNGDTQESYMDACTSLNGDIYAISGNNNIVILNSEGQIKSKFNATQKVGDDVDIHRIAINGEGEIYALDRTKGIFKFAPDGRYINRFGSTDIEATGPTISGRPRTSPSTARDESMSATAVRRFTFSTAMGDISIHSAATRWCSAWRSTIRTTSSLVSEMSMSLGSLYWTNVNQNYSG